VMARKAISQKARAHEGRAPGTAKSEAFLFLLSILLKPSRELLG